MKLGEAEQYVIDLQYSGSNANDREPLDVLLRPYISGGHRRDRILTRQYSVDGNRWKCGVLWPHDVAGG